MNQHLLQKLKTTASCKPLAGWRSESNQQLWILETGSGSAIQFLFEFALHCCFFLIPSLRMLSEQPCHNQPEPSNHAATWFENKKGVVNWKRLDIHLSGFIFQTSLFFLFLSLCWWLGRDCYVAWKLLWNRGGAFDDVGKQSNQLSARVVVWEMAHAGVRPRCVAMCELISFSFLKRELIALSAAVAAWEFSVHIACCYRISKHFFDSCCERSIWKEKSHHTLTRNNRKHSESCVYVCVWMFIYLNISHTHSHTHSLLYFCLCVFCVCTGAAED